MVGTQKPFTQVTTAKKKIMFPHKNICPSFRFALPPARCGGVVREHGLGPWVVRPQQRVPCGGLILWADDNDCIK